MVSMLCVRWRTYFNKVSRNFVEHCYLFNEPMCKVNLDHVEELDGHFDYEYFYTEHYHQKNV